MSPPILILDGGLGTTLEQNHNITFSRTTPLWSSDLLVTNPSTLLACQRSFGTLPVDIILTATYQVSTHAFAGTNTSEFPSGVPREAIPRFLEESVAIAEKAKTPDASVALSIGPYGACMIPGQEYSGKYDEQHDDVDALEKWHRERLELFAEVPDVGERVKYIALETIPRLDEIVAMRKALDAVSSLSSLPFWMTILSPEKPLSLPDGASIEAAVEAMLDPSIATCVPWGVGINCTKVAKLDALLRILETKISHLIDANRIAKWPALVLYPDGTNGEVYNTTTQKWELPDGASAGRQEAWETQVADVVEATSERGQWETIVVGGCCRAGPEDIGKLREVLLK